MFQLQHPVLPLPPRPARDAAEMRAVPFFHRLDRYVLSQLALALALVTTGLVALILSLIHI